VLKGPLGFLLPDRRPMDNMAAGWDRPQEDEFALCLLGLPSPYADIAFPNRPAVYPGSLDLSGLTAAQLADWKRRFVRFLKAVTYRDPRRLVLKSPPHTARVRVLLDLFPDARFVHIVRDPYVVFPSTVNLWTSLGRKHGLQTPADAGRIREKVFAEFRTIYDRLDEARPLVPKGQFHEVRYEQLVKNPGGEMRRVYEALGLGGYDDYRPRLEEYLTATRGYEPNRYTLSDADRDEVTRRWGDVICRYGYARSGGSIPSGG
jgi:omega-hydroxy-beta-dihydromenaquinone-9 sulfotransferase